MFINFDLAGAEWVCVAYLSRDPGMLEVVRSGKSPHVVTGARMAELPEELIAADDAMITDKLSTVEEIAAARASQLPEVLRARILPRKQSIRQLSKRVNHSGNYKIGFKEFALKFEIEESEAKKALHLYSKVAYPGIGRWWDRTDEILRKTRTLDNCFGRRCYFMGAVDEDMFKQGYAFVPQSTVVDITNRAMPLLLDDDSVDFRPAHLAAQVHDSLLIDYVSADYPAMARFAVKLGLDYMSPTLNYGEPFTLGVDMKVGFDWANMKKIKLIADAGKLAGDLAAAAESLRAA